MERRGVCVRLDGLPAWETKQGLKDNMGAWGISVADAILLAQYDQPTGTAIVILPDVESVSMARDYFNATYGPGAVQITEANTQEYRTAVGGAANHAHTSSGLVLPGAALNRVADSGGYVQHLLPARSAPRGFPVSLEPSRLELVSASAPQTAAHERLLPQQRQHQRHQLQQQHRQQLHQQELQEAAAALEGMHLGGPAGAAGQPGRSRGVHVPYSTQLRMRPQYGWSSHMAYPEMGASSMPNLRPPPLLDPRGDPCILDLRGLPFTASAFDVAQWFNHADLPILAIVPEDVYMLQNEQRRPNGQAFVAFRTSQDAEFAMKLDKQYLGKRYIELFMSSREEFVKAVASQSQSL